MFSSLFSLLNACVHHRSTGINITTLVVCVVPAAWAPAAVAQVTPDRARELWASRDWPRAAEAYRELARAEPDEGVYWFRLGYALHASGRIDEAIEAHGRAAEFEILRAGALYNLACAHALAGNEDAAFAALEESARLGGIALNALDADADLESLRGDPRYAEIRASVRRPAEFNQMRRMAFWLGEWDVVDADGTTVGRSTVTLRQNGWIVHESWEDTTGDTGESFSYFDVRAQEWVYTWVDQSGGHARLTGSVDREGQARFRGVESNLRGAAKLVRFTLDAQEDGSVRRVIEESRDGGETWARTLEATYIASGEGD